MASTEPSVEALSITMALPGRAPLSKSDWIKARVSSLKFQFTMTQYRDWIKSKP
jgi:hypothetical protein